MDIGSGKPGKKEREKVPHYLIDIVDPDYPFTAGDFCREAKNACDEILKRGRLPIFVGGTGLYIDSFFDGLSDIPPVDPAVREELRMLLEERGLGHLYDLLYKADPAFAVTIHRHDRQRILRGLEVYRGTNVPLSSYFGAKKGNLSDETVFCGIYTDMDVLRKKIDARVERMVEAGFYDEVFSLRMMGYGPHLKSMKSLGYREIHRFLDLGAGLRETTEEIKANTKKYAKRQMTWFKKNKRIRWFTLAEKKEIINHIHNTMRI